MLQQSEEWFKARLGLCTASRAADVLAKIKSGEAATRKNYRAALIAERLTGTPAESYVNAAMQFGTDNEPLARMAYEAVTGEIVVEVGFIRHETLMAGASPDGLVGEDGLVEIKVPNTATHIDTLLTGMPSTHIPQIQFQLWITGRQWADFVSFDPRLPERMQLHVERIRRDDIYIKQLEKEVCSFLCEVDSTIVRLASKYSSIIEDAATPSVANQI